ncbi:MAG: TetR family transcriptional regulator [Neomegalonema sp.]|nr:TetR family transcriptional regulator [Neomegalonema sp.]
MNSERPPSEQLTPERILSAAVEMLRRYGPEKTTVRDVAGALGVTHAAIYRHFSSKNDLRAAVAEQWLSAFRAPLQEIVERTALPAEERIALWIQTMFLEKRRRAAEEPELFQTYVKIFAADAGALDGHHERLKAQLSAILAQGVAEGQLKLSDPDWAAHAVWDAVACFRAPHFAAQWAGPSAEPRLARVIHLIQAALKSGAL